MDNSWPFVFEKKIGFDFVFPFGQRYSIPYDRRMLFLLIRVQKKKLALRMENESLQRDSVKRLKVEENMNTMNKEFWEKRDAAMKRFMAAKERKKTRVAEITQSLREEYKERTGSYPKFVDVW